MEPYFLPQDQPWPRESYLQVTVLPDLERNTELRELVARTHELLADYPAVAVVPPPWLHVTLQAVLHRSASAIADMDRARLVDALAAAVAGVAPFVLQVGSVLAGAVGVVADLHPDDQIDELFDQVRNATRSVLGAQAVAKDSRPAHMALGYARGAEDSGRMQSQLRRRVRPSHAPLTVDAAHLVEVTPDSTRCLFRWQHLHKFPLAPDGFPTLLAREQ